MRAPGNNRLKLQAAHGCFCERHEFFSAISDFLYTEVHSGSPERLHAVNCAELALPTFEVLGGPYQASGTSGITTSELIDSSAFLRFYLRQLTVGLSSNENSLDSWLREARGRIFILGCCVEHRGWRKA